MFMGLWMSHDQEGQLNMTSEIGGCGRLWKISVEPYE